MTPEEIKRRIEDIQRRHDTASKHKSVLEGQVAAKKDELAALILEIKGAGYDPKKLVAERDKAQQDLEAMIVEMEKNLTEVEKALSAYNSKK